jgi:hypothetical protein
VSEANHEVEVLSRWWSCEQVKQVVRGMRHWEEVPDIVVHRVASLDMEDMEMVATWMGQMEGLVRKEYPLEPHSLGWGLYGHVVLFQEA